MRWDPKNQKKCDGCGELKFRTEFQQKLGHHLCRKCAHVKAQSPRIRLSFIRSKARQRGIEFNLTVDELASVLSKPCTYCEGPLALTGGGIDRIDNKIGYIASNIISACAVCNWLRHDIFAFEEMKDIGAVVKKIRAMRGPDRPLLTLGQRLRRTRIRPESVAKKIKNQTERIRRNKEIEELIS